MTTQPYGWRGGLEDVGNAVGRHALWRALGRNDVRHRYSGSLLGAAWVSLNITLLVATLTFLFAGPLGVAWRTYAAYVAVGLVVWNFIQGSLAEAPLVFVTAADTIRNAPLPLSLFAFRLVWRNMLVFFYQAPIALLLLLVLGSRPGALLWTLPLAAGLAGVAALSASLILAILGARFRDVAQLVTNLLQLLFFVTPIFWVPAALGVQRARFAAANPIFAFVDILRAPLLGRAPMTSSWPIAAASTLLLAILALILLGRLRGRVPYWI